MTKFSRMILDSLKVTDDDDEFEDDENELRERRERQQKKREERKAVFTKKEAPAMRRFESEQYEEDEEDDEIARRRANRVQVYRREAQEREQRGYSEAPRTGTQSRSSQYQDKPSQPQRSQQTQNYRTPPMRSAASSADVCIIRPKRFEECQEIIDVLKSGRVIFLTFDSTNPAIANRIMDFSFGAVYALDAQIIQLSGNNFVIAPEDAEISGEYLNSLTAANYGSWNNSVN